MIALISFIFMLFNLSAWINNDKVIFLILAFVGLAVLEKASVKYTNYDERSEK